MDYSQPPPYSSSSYSSTMMVDIPKADLAKTQAYNHQEEGYTYASASSNTSDHTLLPTTQPQPLKPRRPRGCCRRFWWAWTIAILILIGVGVACIVLFAAIPHIVKSITSNSSLALTSLRLLSPTNNTIQISLNVDWHFETPIRLEAMTLEMSINGQDSPLFAAVEIGDVEATDGNNKTVHITTDSYDAAVTDETVDFVKRMLQDGNLTINFKGKTTAWYMKLPNQVEVNKDVSVAGFDDLKQTEIMRYESATDGSLDFGVVFPSSLVVVELGGVDFSISKNDDTTLGTGSFDSLVLGDKNTQTMRAELDVADMKEVAGSTLKASATGAALEWTEKVLSAIQFESRMAS